MAKVSGKSLKVLPTTPKPKAPKDVTMKPRPLGVKPNVSSDPSISARNTQKGVKDQTPISIPGMKTR